MLVVIQLPPVCLVIYGIPYGITGYIYVSSLVRDLRLFRKHITCDLFQFHAAAGHGAILCIFHPVVKLIYYPSAYKQLIPAFTAASGGSIKLMSFIAIYESTVLTFVGVLLSVAADLYAMLACMLTFGLLYAESEISRIQCPIIYGILYTLHILI